MAEFIIAIRLFQTVANTRVKHSREKPDRRRKLRALEIIPVSFVFSARTKKKLYSKVARSIFLSNPSHSVLDHLQYFRVFFCFLLSFIVVGTKRNTREDAGILARHNSLMTG